MQLAVADTHIYDREAFDHANDTFGHAITYFEPRLTSSTARLAAGFPAVCSFVNDRVDAEAIGLLHAGGTRLLALRSAGTTRSISQPPFTRGLRSRACRSTHRMPSLSTRCASCSR